MSYCNGVDIAKRSAWKEFITFHYWYVLEKGFRFQSSACNSCHNVVMALFGINNISILNSRGVDYYWIIFGTDKVKPWMCWRIPTLPKKSVPL